LDFRSTLDSDKTTYTVEIEAKGISKSLKTKQVFKFTEYFDTFGYLHRA